MAYKKRKESSEVRKARKRLNGIRSIDESADLGNGLTVEFYDGEIQKLVTKTDNYNKLLSTVDGQLSELEQAEKDLGELSDRMLNAVGTKFGYDSIEYEKAGGVRKSERKRSTRKNGANTKAA